MLFLEGVHRACWNGLTTITLERYQKEAPVSMLFVRSMMSGRPFYRPTGGAGVRLRVREFRDSPVCDLPGEGAAGKLDQTEDLQVNEHSSGLGTDQVFVNVLDRDLDDLDDLVVITA